MLKNNAVSLNWLEEWCARHGSDVGLELSVVSVSDLLAAARKEAARDTNREGGGLKMRCFKCGEENDYGVISIIHGKQKPFLCIKCFRKRCKYFLDETREMAVMLALERDW